MGINTTWKITLLPFNMGPKIRGRWKESKDFVPLQLAMYFIKILYRFWACIRMNINF